MIVPECQSQNDSSFDGQKGPNIIRLNDKYVNLADRTPKSKDDYFIIGTDTETLRLDRSDWKHVRFDGVDADLPERGNYCIDRHLVRLECVDFLPPKSFARTVPIYVGGNGRITIIHSASRRFRIFNVAEIESDIVDEWFDEISGMKSRAKTRPVERPQVTGTILPDGSFHYNPVIKIRRSRARFFCRVTLAVFFVLSAIAIAYFFDAILKYRIPIHRIM